MKRKVIESIPRLLLGLGMVVVMSYAKGTEWFIWVCIGCAAVVVTMLEAEIEQRAAEIEMRFARLEGEIDRLKGRSG